MDYDTWLSTNPAELTAREEELFFAWCKENGVDPEAEGALEKFEEANDQRI